MQAMHPMMAMASQMMQQMGQNNPTAMPGMGYRQPPHNRQQASDWKTALQCLPEDLRQEWRDQIIKDEKRQQVQTFCASRIAPMQFWLLSLDLVVCASVSWASKVAPKSCIRV